MRHVCLAFITLSIISMETITSRSHLPLKAQNSSPLLATVFFSSYLSVDAQRCFFFLSFFLNRCVTERVTRGYKCAASVLFSRKSLQCAPTINANRGHFVTRLYTSCLEHVRVFQASGAWVWVADGAKSREINTVKTSPGPVLYHCARKDST